MQGIYTSLAACNPAGVCRVSRISPSGPPVCFSFPCVVFSVGFECTLFGGRAGELGTSWRARVARRCCLQLCPLGNTARTFGVWFRFVGNPHGHPVGTAPPKLRGAILPFGRWLPILGKLKPIRICDAAMKNDDTPTCTWPLNVTSSIRNPEIFPPKIDIVRIRF